MATSSADVAGASTPGARARERKSVLLRLDPAVYDALARWAGDEIRSVNAHLEMLLRDGLRRAGRLPAHAAPLRQPGRPAQAGLTAPHKDH